MAVAELPRCSNCFHYLPSYKGGICPNCGHYEKIEYSKDPPKPLEPDETSVLCMLIGSGLPFLPEDMDRKEKFLIEAGDKSTIIQPPEYKSIFRLHRNTDYTVTVKTVYDNKVLHTSQFELTIHNTEYISLLFEKKTVQTKGLFRSANINVLE